MIFLVDDSVINCEIVIVFLKVVGFCVDYVENGVVVCVKVVKNWVYYVVVLMDVQMLEMDGIIVMWEICCYYLVIDLLIIVMIVYVYLEECQNCFDVGMNEYFMKLIDFKLLIWML